MKILDKILMFFGLMRIGRARHTQQESFKLYARAIADYARSDFGVVPNPNVEADAVRWSDECFNQCLAEYSPDMHYIGAWEKAPEYPGGAIRL